MAREHTWSLQDPYTVTLRPPELGTATRGNQSLRASTFSLRSHKDPFAFVRALPRTSDQKIRMKCYLILRKLLYIEYVKYF